jgi:TolA-binding protein
MQCFRTYSILALTGLLILTTFHGGIAFADELEAEGQKQLDFANGLFHRAFFEEAVEEYERYLTRFPNGTQRVIAWRRLGEAAYAAGGHEKALKAFEQLSELGLDETTRRETSLSKGEVLYFLKRYGDAVAVLTALTAPEVPPELRSRALYYRGKAHFEKGDTEASQADLNRLIKELPDTALAPFGRYQLGFVFMAREEYENAAIAFSEVAQSKADDELRMESRYRAAEIYDKIGWFSAAVGAYERLRKDFPGSDYAKRADYGYAWALYHAGSFPEALVSADAFLKAYPDSPYRMGVAYLRGNCLQQQQQYDQALAAYKGLATQFPDSEFAPRAQYKSAWVQYLRGEYVAAREEITAFLQARKESPLVGDAAFLLGSILVSEGNYEDAHEEFRLVAVKYPDSEFGVEALYKSAECLGQLGLTDQAAKAFEEFAKRYPDNPLTEQAILRAGDAQFDAKDFEAAVLKYQRLLTSPTDKAVEEQSLYRLALTYYNMKDFPSSAKTLETLLSRFPDSRHGAEAQYRIAEYHLRETKDALKALEGFEKAMAAAPDGPFAGRALRGLALARYEQKDLDKAAALFLRLMKEYPTLSLNEETYAWTGQHFFDHGQWVTAAQAFEALLRSLPNYANPERIRFKIAECREKEGKTEGAIQQYQAVVDTAPSSSKAAEARFRMAGLYESLKDGDKAFALYEQTANSNTGDVAARARFRLGELLEAREEYDQAARSFMRVAILFLHEELSPRALWRAGQSFSKGGSEEQSRKAYEELIADYPDSELAQQARELLKLEPTQP